MIKLKNLLLEGVEQDFTFSWGGDQYFHLNTRGMYKITLLIITNKDGFEGVEKHGRDYFIKYKGNEYTLEKFIKLRDIQKMMKDKIKRWEKSVERQNKSLSYADRSYSKDSDDIYRMERGIKIMKKYT